jgi:hypothetical protein
MPWPAEPYAHDGERVVVAIGTTAENVLIPSGV